MYITGDIITIISRLNQLPENTGEVLTGFIVEAQGYMASGILTSGHRGQIDQIGKLKNFQFSQLPSGLAISIL